MTWGELALLLVTDPAILGGITWASALITVIGLSIAIYQIRKVKKATDAASEAVAEAISSVRSRELIIDMSNALMNVNNAQNATNRGQLEVANVHLGLLKSSVIRMREIQLRRANASVDFDGMLTTTGKVIKDFERALEAGEGINNIRVSLELRVLADNLETEIARLRYLRDDEEE
jgi:hypothetical protein